MKFLCEYCKWVSHMLRILLGPKQSVHVGCHSNANMINDNPSQSRRPSMVNEVYDQRKLCPNEKSKTLTKSYRVD